ncbi:MAG: type II toxin-antitoxin system RelE/ParE family toxin [Clostridiales bacterium]|nr:type II toxin-antitoxin system RelE/ParE family toxin [Clostridiales bacterium]
MNRTFKEVPSFTTKWHSLGLTDDDLCTLEEILLKDPKTGDVISGTGGIRKIRIPFMDTGKRSGGRVIYVDIEIKECIYFLNVYIKSEQTDLTEKEKKLLKKLVEVLKEE